MICSLERSGKFAVPVWLIFGGAASYAIYLVHNPLLSLASRIFRRLGMDWPIALVLSVIMAVAVGGLYFVIVEKPLMRMAKRLRAKLLLANN